MKYIFIEIIIILVILAGASVYDLRNHKIPNWWVFGGTLIGLGVLWLFRTRSIDVETSSVWLIIWRMYRWFLFRCLAVIVLFFPLFYCRMMGAADIKLMALMCGFLGSKMGISAILCSFLIGASMALIKMLVQRSLIQRLGYLYAYFKRLILTKEVVAYHSPARDGYQHTIPFALCLFLGTFIAVIL